VLVVEDDALISMWIEEALLDAGFSVVCASNADGAISVLSSDIVIDYVITDIDMPGSMDGLKLAILIRDRWPPIKLVIASGKHRLTEADMPEGAVFLSKPYRQEELVIAIQGAR
jgi:DNA-binding NtrC family response regulator